MTNRKARLLKYLLVIMVSAIFFDLFVQDQISKRYHNEQILNVSLHAASLRARLEKQLSKNVFIIHGLASYISLNPDLGAKEFKEFSSEIIKYSDMLRAITAAPSGVIEYVYPLKGNEVALGYSHDLLELPEIDTTRDNIFVSQPIDSGDGRKVILGSIPVFSLKKKGKPFWGYVSAAIDPDVLFEQSGISSAGDLKLAIRVASFDGESGQIIYGSEDLFDSNEQAVVMAISVLSSMWELAAVPRHGWGNNPPYSILFHLLFLVVACVTCFAVYNLFRKNSEVETVQEMLFEAQSLAGMGSWSADLASGEVWCSDEMYSVLGMEPYSYKPTRSFLFNLIHPDDSHFFSEAYENACESRTSYVVDFRIQTRAGDIKYLTAKGRFDYNEEGKAVRAYGTVLDITKRKHFENMLQESNLRFERISNRLNKKFILFSHTVDGEFISLSEGVDILGYGSAENFIGKKWFDCIPWSDGTVDFVAQVNTPLYSGEIDTGEYEISYLHPDGTEHFLIVYAYISFSYERNESVFEGIAIDSTDRKLKETRLEGLTRAIENAPVSVVITDIDGNITYVNPYFTKETGYSREEAIGENPRILKSGEHNESFYKDLWDTIVLGQTWRGELVNKRKDGTFYWESASISPVYNSENEIVNYVAVKEDINDKKELERLKGDVDLIMRHDLKTPLNGIIGLPGLLLMDDNLDAEQRKLVKVIEDSGKNMLHMIDMSLDMFKMETGRYEYRPKQVEAVNVVRRVVDHAGTKLTARKVTAQILLNGQPVKSESSCILWGEERLIYSMVSGLLVNGIEASSAGDTVTIKLQSGDRQSIAICNQGVVPVEMRERFFEKYATAGKTSGTGLGTYSAKMMADAMNYSILMETSDVDNSTCIKIVLPDGISL